MLVLRESGQPSFEQQPLAGKILGVPCNGVLVTLTVALSLALWEMSPKSCDD